MLLGLDQPVDTGGVNRLDIVVNSGQNLQLTGAAGNGGAGGVTPIVLNTYTGLGNIVLGSGGVGGNLGVNCDVTLTGTIDGVINNTGRLVVQNGRNVTFDGVIGATRLNLIRIGEVAGGATVNFNANVTATTIDYQNAISAINLADTVIVTGDIDSTLGVGGRLTFLGSGRVTGKVGQTN